jgi:ribonuclease P protein component
MLPAERRVRRREEFAAAVRDGRRTAGAGIVVHAATGSADRPARAGFVVGRTVGDAVTRNRLRRQLRHLMTHHLDGMPAGTDLVVRALPGAARLSRRELAGSLSRLLDRSVASGAGPLGAGS